MNLTAEQWNALYPVGTPVRYWPIRSRWGRPGGEPRDTKTRSVAWDIPSGSTVVLCEGQAGGLDVQHLMPLLTEQPANQELYR